MEKLAFITMDVESYYDTECLKKKGVPYDGEYCCADSVSTFINLVERYGGKATLFLNCEFTIDSKPHIEKALLRGHSLALHSLKHIEATSESEEEFKSDIVEGIKHIKENFGVLPKGYRAPCFKIDDERFQAVKENFLYDSGAFGFRKNKNFKNEDEGEYEKLNSCVYRKGGFYEISTCSVNVLGINFPVSGGGYMRLAPWWLCKLSLKKYLKKENVYLFYVHPFEICDKKLPLPKCTNFGEKIYLTRGRKTYLRRIEKIFNLLTRYGYKFKSIDEYIESL